MKNFVEWEFFFKTTQANLHQCFTFLTNITVQNAQNHSVPKPLIPMRYTSEISGCLGGLEWRVSRNKRKTLPLVEKDATQEFQSNSP